MITEQQYLEAIKIINEYTEQQKIIKEQEKKQAIQALNKIGITKTPSELYYDWDTYFPTMEVRLFNILRRHFYDKRICDITKKEFLSKRLGGKKGWSNLCDITGGAH